MFGTRSTAFALLSLAAAVACNDESTNPTGFATLRLANATSSPIDVASGALIATGNANVGFGTSSGCVTTNVFEPDVIVSPTATTNTFASFAPELHADQTYVIVDYPNSAGLPAFATINSTFLPAIGQAGLIVFNGMAGSRPFDVFVTSGTAPLGTAAAFGIGYKTVSGLIPVTPGTPLTVTLTFAGTQTVAALAQNLTFTAGVNSVLVIAAPPAVGSPGPVTLPRTFLVPAC